MVVEKYMVRWQSAGSGPGEAVRDRLDDARDERDRLADLARRGKIAASNFRIFRVVLTLQEWEIE